MFLIVRSYDIISFFLSFLLILSKDPICMILYLGLLANILRRYIIMLSIYEYTIYINCVASLAYVANLANLA